MSSETRDLVRLEGVKKHFRTEAGLFSAGGSWLRAVDGVDLTIRQGETLGLVGESGCGKSTLGHLVLSLDRPTAGRILFDGLEVGRGGRRGLKALRREMQVIFQDPFASLNPRHTVESILKGPFAVHGMGTGAQRRSWAAGLLQDVELSEEALPKYPHEFSGGQRQRICIARALALKPRFIVCDEATSSLDVSIQAQILNLLIRLQQQHQLTYLFISHNLNVVLHVSDRVAVMYLGRIVEIAPAEALQGDRVHPYTAALLYANPDPDPFLHKPQIILGGEIPSPIHPPSGCHFHPRCPKRMAVCDRRVPQLYGVGPGHRVRCFLYEQPEGGDRR